MDVPLILAVVAGLLGAVEAVRTRGQSLLAWAVLALALAAVWPVIT